jgi:hypothetical protein
MIAPAKLAVPLTLLFVTLTACQTTTSTGTDNERRTVQFYCDNTDPIRPSRSDTLETQRQVASQVAAYLTLCTADGEARTK